MRARLGIEHGLAVFGGELALRYEVVRVPVQDHVDAVGLPGQLLGVDGIKIHVVAQVRDGHHVVGTLVAGVVDIVLEHVVIGVGAERVDVVAPSVLEIGRRR